MKHEQREQERLQVFVKRNALYSLKFEKKSSWVSLNDFTMMTIVHIFIYEVIISFYGGM
jgi:hypothetical protein